MNIKSEKGITGVDISVAVIIILLFVGLITTLIYNYTKNSKDIERKSTATYMIIDILEHAKTSNYDDVTEENMNYYINHTQKFLDSDGISQKKGYKISVRVEDKEDLFGEGSDDVMKKVIATVEYLVNNQEEKLQIYTIIKNPNYIKEFEPLVWDV